MDWGHRYIAPACPGCGKPDAARMGKSTWGHNRSCCSDACGERVGRALEAAHESEQYKFFTRMQEHAEHMLAEIEAEEISCARMEAGGPEELPNPYSFAINP